MYVFNFQRPSGKVRVAVLNKRNADIYCSRNNDKGVCVGQSQAETMNIIAL